MSISDEMLARISKAKSTQVESATEIWNARLDILKSIGDTRGIYDHLRTPVELAGDNCGCNSACGMADGLQTAVNPAARG